MTWRVVPQKNSELKPFKNTLRDISCVAILHQQYRVSLAEVVTV